MKKILTILLFIISLQAFSQTYVPNQFLYNWTRGAEFSGDVLFSSLASGTDTIFLVINSETGEVDSIGITELKGIFGSVLTPPVQDTLLNGGLMILQDTSDYQSFNQKTGGFVYQLKDSAWYQWNGSSFDAAFSIQVLPKTWFGDTASNEANKIYFGDEGFITTGREQQFSALYNYYNGEAGRSGLGKFWIADVYTGADSTDNANSRGAVWLARTADNTAENPQFCRGGYTGHDYLLIRWDAWNGTQFNPNTASMNFEATYNHRKNILPSRIAYSVTNPFAASSTETAYLEYYGYTYAGIWKKNSDGSNVAYEEWKDSAMTDPWVLVPKKYVDSVQIFQVKDVNDIALLDQEALVSDGSQMNARNINKIQHGTTANRPSSPEIGQMYFDTDLSPPRAIIFNGTAWVNIDGTTL